MSTTQSRAAAIHSEDSALDRLAHVIDHVSHLLPAQGPITSFIHHNTLHAFEHLPFDKAVRQGGQIFGCEPYLPEADFRAELARGRIQIEDLQAVLREDLANQADEPILHFASRLELRLAMLRFPLAAGTAAELHWFMTETEALRRFDEHVPPATRTQIVEQTRHWAMRDLQSVEPLDRAFQESHRRMRQPLSALFQQFERSSMERWADDTWQAFTLQALWRVCRAGIHGVKWNPTSEPRHSRHRDLLLEATGEDADQLVNELLIRLAAGLTDQGLARWPLPGRRHGFLHAFCQLFGAHGDPPDRWLRGVREEIDRKTSPRVSSLEWIHESLAALGVAEEDWEPFIRDTLLALRGWAGMIRQVALRSDNVVHTIESDSLLDYLAIRLLFERFALDFVARRSLPKYDGNLAKLRQHLRNAAPFDSRETRCQNVDVRAFVVFQLAQFLGWLPRDLYRLSHSQWALLVGEIEAFDNFERRRIYQRAYERRYRIETLDAVAVAAAQPTSRPGHCRFQAVFCIDEREESFRRHLEEVAPNVETFGVAGFFGVAMYYRGAADAHYLPLCPVVVRPQHWVVEDVAFPMEEQHQRRAWFRRSLGSASHQVHVASRTAVGGAASALLGVIASAPLVARVVFPRLTASFRKWMHQLVAPPVHTQLQLERSHATPSSESGGIGYSVNEMADIVERLLRDIGLTGGFARLVFIVGHGSSSLNNPHEPAHDCGACGGARGGPNARAFAQMANDARVRSLLDERGVAVPAETTFVGAYHNTCDESVELFDLDRAPLSHKADLAEAGGIWLETRKRNARERCRRFNSASLSISDDDALHHVEARAEDLAQTRPEYGHCTNAVCVVGRRARTRNLFMDRRSFLMSYDPTQDDVDGTILARILAAVVPVCAGINLEYYFSRVDSTGWGCGTKLPHNITSLLGVMDGAASDLRPGLPWQMVELHEPVRLLFVIETSPAAMLRIMERNPMIGQLCRNAWVQIATLDPRSNELQLFDGEDFVPYWPTQEHLPRAHSSVSWYRGWRDHLGYAMITPPARGSEPIVIERDTLLYWLGVLVLLAPTMAMTFAGLSAVAEKRPSEKLLARLTQLAICIGLLSAFAVLATMLITGIRSVPVELGYWTLLPDYHFEFRLLFDRLSVPFAIITFILCGTIGAFAARYMHRERGYQRFFSLLLVFVVGMLLTTLAGTIEVLFAGWELVGLSSALLVAFFHERQNPVRNGLHIWTIYRFSDAALLAAVVLVHHLSGSGEFNSLLGAGPWPAGTSTLTSNQALVVGLLILVAAAGKSGLVPFSGWLPRAMEGPTPSSAVFYGALSVHLGAFLLLRLCPILELSLWLCAAVVAIGLATAAYATITSHVQTDIKSALAFASLAQVGLIVAEIGVGFRYFALVHILGHACFRMLQFLRAPNLLHDYHNLENAIGSHLPSTGVYWEKQLSSSARRRLYRFALSRGYFDAWLRDYLVYPFVNVFRQLDRLERRWTALLSGQPSEPAANRRLQAQFMEDVV